MPEQTTHPAPAGAGFKGGIIMPGPFVYPNVESLVGKGTVPDRAGNFKGECVSLVKYHIPALYNAKTPTWKEGVNVIETLKNGGTIEKGTAIATFHRDGKFQSGDGHAAFYAGHFLDANEGIRIIVIEQYLGTWPTKVIESRALHNKEKKANGEWDDRSNNGRAFSVIML
jgi:hypothetical protein